MARMKRRSRSELMRMAFRQYVGRWEWIFEAGTKSSWLGGYTEADVARAVKARRRSQTR